MKKILALLLFAAPLAAQNTYGRIDFSLQTAQGQAVPGAQIFVYAQAACGTAQTGTLAQLYSTANGTTLNQPLLTDGFGHAVAYAAQGCVTVTYNSPYTGLLTYTDQNVISASDVQFSASASITITSVTASVNNQINVMAPPYNAQCNMQVFPTGTIAANSTTLIGSGFTFAMVGRTAIVWAAGALRANGAPGPLITTVVSVQSGGTQATLANAATTAVTGQFEIGTIDTAAIQSAYNAAASANAVLLFPSNKGLACLTGTIDLSAGGTVANPVSIMGQGSMVTTIAGLPGQDVFQWPDGIRVNNGYQTWRGFKVQVDGSEDVSSSTFGAGQIWNPYVVGGSPGFVTTANRVAGVAANGSGGITAVSPAVAAGPVVFDDATLSGTTLTCPHCNFPTNYAPNVAAQLAITSSGLGLTNASFTIVNSTTATVTGGTAGTNQSGSFGFLNGGVLTGIIPGSTGWPIGNCGVVFPASSGANVGGVQMQFEDLFFLTPSIPNQQETNYTCSMFFQQPPYYAKFEHISSQFTYYGIVDAIPTSANNITWTPDTRTMFAMSLSNRFPLIQIAGNHSLYDGVNLYGGGQTFSYGAMMFNGPENKTGTSTVTHLYWECYGGSTFGNSGTGTYWAGTQWTINAASLMQCNGPQIQWTAGNSFVTDVEMGSLAGGTAAVAPIQLSGAANTFLDLVISTGNSTLASMVNDTGVGNYVQATPSNSLASPEVINQARCQPGMFDGEFLSGYTATPFTSFCGLILDYATVSLGGSGAGSVTFALSTPGDGSPQGSGYLFSPSTSSGQVVLIAKGQPFLAGPGYRVPLTTSMNLVVGLQTSATGTISFTVRDATASTTIQTCNYTVTAANTFAYHGQFGSADACNVNTSAVPTGDLIEVFYFNGVLGNESISTVSLVPNFSSPIPLASGSTSVTLASSDNSTKVANTATVHSIVTNALSVTGSCNFLNGCVEVAMVGGTAATGLLNGLGGAFNPCTSATYVPTGSGAATPSVAFSTSTATAGNCAGWMGTAANSYMNRQPVMQGGIGYNASSDFASGTSSRIWFGLTNCTAATQEASDNPACAYVMIRYSNTAADAEYQCVSSNGTSQTVTPIGTVIPVTTFTTWNINIGPSSAVCTVGTTSATVSTTLPASTTTLSPAMWNVAAASTAVHLETNGWYIYSQNGLY